MKAKELATLVSKLEGKKSEASIGNIREILSIVGYILLTLPVGEYEDTLENLLLSGSRKDKQLNTKPRGKSGKASKASNGSKAGASE